MNGGQIDMSIGRIEMVDGKKQYVRYATLGGGAVQSLLMIQY